MRSVKPLRLLFIAASSLVITAQAQAGLEQNLAQCATITDKLDRLICYDNLAASAKNLTTTPTPVAVAVPAAAAASTPPANAMTSQTAEEQFGSIKKAEADEIEKIYLTVKSIDKDAYDALKISFENGQIWKQSDSKRYKLKVGEKVYIEKGAFSSFFLGTESKNSTIRVKRIK